MYLERPLTDSWDNEDTEIQSIWSVGVFSVEQCFINNDSAVTVQRVFRRQSENPDEVQQKEDCRTLLFWRGRNRRYCYISAIRLNVKQFSPFRTWKTSSEQNVYTARVFMEVFQKIFLGHVISWYGYAPWPPLTRSVDMWFLFMGLLDIAQVMALRFPFVRKAVPNEMMDKAGPNFQEKIQI